MRVGRIFEWRLRGLGEVWNVRVDGAAALGSCLRQVVRAKGLRQTKAMVGDVLDELRKEDEVMQEEEVEVEEDGMLNADAGMRAMPRQGCTQLTNIDIPCSHSIFFQP